MNKPVLLKIAMAICLFWIPLSAFAAGYAEVTKIFLNLRGVTIEEVFKAIEDQTEFSFFYDVNEINTDKKVNIKVENENINTVLDKILDRKSISYKVTDRHIVLYKDRSDSKKEDNVVVQQGFVVSGVVTDEDDQELPGVTVLNVTTQKGATTDIDGRYSIEASQGDQIMFTYIGFASQTLSAQQTLNVKLLSQLIGLEEVVVIGYGTLDRKQVTSSITSIAARDIPQGIGGATVMSSLTGKVNSLIVQEDASPNASTTLQLRGMASYNASRSPLVVIDGMPGGDIRSVVQEDIQSIDILKDASAGAIYGTRATGGVILITTKQAQEGKMKMTYTSEVIFKQPFGFLGIMNASDYLKYKPGATDYGYDINHMKEAMSKNPTSNRQVLSMQGGSRDARIYASVVYEDNRGIRMYDTRQDLGGRMNANFKFWDGWLDLNPRIDYRQTMRNLSVPGLGIATNPTRNPYDPNQWSKQSGLDDPNTIIDAGLITNTSLQKWFRPEVEIKLNILPITGLSYTQSMGYQNNQRETLLYEPTTATLTEGQNRTGEGTAEISFNSSEILNMDGYLSFIRSFGEHYFNASLGYSYYEANGHSYRVRNYGFVVDGVKMWNIGSGTYHNNPNVSYRSEIASSKSITERLMAYFGRLHYSFKGKYIASITVRREGSSKFSENNRWGNFWQASAAWRISQENFMSSVPIIDDLKLRMAYGVTGNEGFSANYAATVYSSSGYWPLPIGGWARSYGASSVINPRLGWEEKHEWNIGVDFEILNSRLWGKLDLFRREVRGLIYEVPVPQPPNIANRMYENIGTLENSGWEIELGAAIVKNKTWQYNSKINVFQNNTKMGSMYGEGTYFTGGYVGRAGDTHRIEEGATVGAFYLYKFAGFDSEGRFQAYDKDDKVIVPETDGKRLEDKKYMGNYLPRAVVGWTHDINYKNWSLAMTLTSWIKFDVYNATEHTLGTVGGLPGAYGNQLLIAFTDNAPIKGQTLECDYFLKDGTFLKLQNFTLSYRLRTKELTKIMESARIYLTGNNVLKLTKYSGLNPEVNITGWERGIDSDQAPQTRSFTLGVQLNF